MPSPLGCSFGGRMRLWRKKKRQRKRQKLVPSPRAPSAVDAFGVCDAQQENLRRACGEFVESAQQESFAAKFAESYREFNGQVDSAADGTTAHAAAAERVQFPLLSRANPGRYVRDVEVDTDPDEVPTSTPSARLRADDEPRGARAPRKRKWDGEPDLSRRELSTAPIRRRANNEPAQPKQKVRNLVLEADGSADIGRAAITRNSPSSEEDVSAEVLGCSTDLLAPKARVPLEEARRPSGHRGMHAATAGMPTMERYLPSEQVPFDDSPSNQGPLAQAPSAQERFREEPSAKTPSAKMPLA
ncbi:hypothetical protein AXG93_4863s1020 [Marchantia polymorpha subsp. ruderalis]|uniref:Uncharacterized protein n=1 Tax=Marchantia polymorpha subsp. ruderalis TaxID=1480154 RepID=A0A176VV17_MARPO|nr:hypothetical protein AXG93_4863s1020 [Marchantia polymorpha subsp. ruderalis]